MFLIHVTRISDRVVGVSRKGLRPGDGMLGKETIYFADDIAKASQYCVPQADNKPATQRDPWLGRSHPISEFDGFSPQVKTIFGEKVQWGSYEIRQE